MTTLIYPEHNIYGVGLHDRREEVGDGYTTNSANHTSGRNNNTDEEDNNNTNNQSDDDRDNYKKHFLRHDWTRDCLREVEQFLSLYDLWYEI